MVPTGFSRAYYPLKFSRKRKRSEDGAEQTVEVSVSGPDLFSNHFVQSVLHFYPFYNMTYIRARMKKVLIRIEQRQSRVTSITMTFQTLGSSG